MDNISQYYLTKLRVMTPHHRAALESAIKAFKKESTYYIVVIEWDSKCDRNDVIEKLFKSEKQAYEYAKEAFEKDDSPRYVVDIVLEPNLSED